MRFLVFVLLLVGSSVSASDSSENAVPPIPARIGGTVTVGTEQLPANVAIRVVATRSDGSAFVPAAEDRDGLNDYGTNPDNNSPPEI